MRVIVNVTLPLRIESVANLREHWRQRAKRAQLHRNVASWALRPLAVALKPADPLTVTLTRIGPRPLDDDNLAGGFKAVRDGVADWLGRDDADPLLTWVYAQERGAPKTYACRIEIAL
jgi:hypothetical protein